MNIFKCKDCGYKTTENNIILTINSSGEWTLHCPKCNSELLELANELCQSPHSLKTYYEIEEDYDNEG